MFKQTVKRVLAVAMLSSIATFAYAEDSAPVYDVDSYPPAFDGQPEGAPLTGQPDMSGPQQPSSSLSLSIDQRISRVEKQINNIQSKDLSSKIDSLLSEIQTLRGQVEQLTHQLQQVQAQQRTMYSDLDKRISSSQTASKPHQTLATEESAASDEDAGALKSKPANAVAIKTKTKIKTKVESAADTSPTADDTKPAAEASTKVSNQQPNVAEEQQIYQTAYDLIKAKKYNEAIAALQKMLQKYPSGQFAANAHYWLGELYGLLGKNDQSATEFGTVVKGYPDSPKVSDAQLKLGLIYTAQFKWPDAKSAFKKVINHYPGTASARLAAEQLKQIKEAGH